MDLRQIFGLREYFIWCERQRNEKACLQVRIEECSHALLLIRCDPFAKNRQTEGICDLQAGNPAQTNFLRQGYHLHAGSFGVDIPQVEGNQKTAIRVYQYRSRCSVMIAAPDCGKIPSGKISR